MAILNSLTAGIAGLQAQAASLGHISDNIANSRTTGYKRVDTAFNSLVLQSSSSAHSPGGVIARPSFANTVEGNVQNTDRNTNLRIAGQGFFSVSRLIGTGAERSVSPERFYTRDGSFELNVDRILVNNAGFALNGFLFDNVTGTFNTTVEPISVTADIDAPVPTRNIDLRANLPTDPTPGEPIDPVRVTITDATGSPRDIFLNFRPGVVDNTWRLTIDAPGAVGSLPLAGELPGFAATATNNSTQPTVAPRAQVETVNFISAAGNNIAIGDEFNVTVNGVTFTQEVTVANAGTLGTLDGVAQALADQINSRVPPLGVTALVVPDPVTGQGQLQVRSSLAGRPFTVTSAVESGSPTVNTVTPAGGALLLPTDPVPTTAIAAGFQAGTATTPARQVIAFAGSDIDIGDVFQIAIDPPGTAGLGPADPASPAAQLYSITVTATNIGSFRNLNGVVSALGARINANVTTNQVFATVQGNSLTIQSTRPTTDPATDNNDFAVTLIGVSNALAATTTSFTQPNISNIDGARQITRLSVTGQPGDVGTTYSIELNSPQNITVSGTLPAVVPPAAATAEFDFSGVGTLPTSVQSGQRYAVTVSNYTYAIQITEQNLGLYPDVDAVLTDLASRVSAESTPDISAAYDPGTQIITVTYPTNVTPTLSEVAATSIPVFSEPISYVTDGTETSIDEIAGNIANRINTTPGIPVTASATGGLITITSNADGTSFVATPSAVAGITPPFLELGFGGQLPGSTTFAPAGTLTTLNGANVDEGNATVSPTNTPGDPARITFTVDYGDGPQQISLNLGDFGVANGLTQFDGEDLNVISLLQDGNPAGTFQDLEILENGDVVANFDNGQRRTIANIPIVLFNNANGLQRETGNVFTETVTSGIARFNQTGLNGAGVLASSSLEGSNVDIATEFTRLILAQRTYSANARIITTTDEILNETINLRR